MITSRSNSTVKQIRALRTRKERGATGLFFVEGIKLVGQAAEHNARIATCVVAPELLSSSYADALVGSLRSGGVPIVEVTHDVFLSISLKDGPHGLGAVVQQQWHALDTTDPDIGLCWIALQAAADPGNLGTIIRTSDAAGGAGVILLGASTDPYDPTAVRASMGSIFAQKVARANFTELLAWARAHECMIVGTADAAVAEFRGAAYRKPLVLLMGSEREGLSQEQFGACDEIVRIPMHGSGDSLNLAVATGIMLYELEARWGGTQRLGHTIDSPSSTLVESIE